MKLGAISKILLVNDSKTQQIMIQDMLSLYVVRIAESELQMFDLLDDWYPDLIIINNLFIDGNGYQLSQKMRLESQFDDIPIILTASLDRPIDAERAYEVGCNNYLTKPFTKEQLLNSIAEVQGNDQKSDQPKILIVEDSKTIRTMIANTFIRNNYKVEQAENGGEALTILKTFTPDVMTVDIEMPKMDGLTFCQHVRACSEIRDIPIVIIAGVIDYNLRVRGYQVGVIEFFPKPFRSKNILNYIDALVNSLKIKKNIRVLVVEDAIVEQHIMKFALMRAGYTPYIVSNGEEALEIIESIEFNLILLDIILEGRDGFEICQQLRENDKFNSIPIIIVTGLQEETSISKSFETGANDFIKKPFTVEELMNRIEINLEKKLGLQNLRSEMPKDNIIHNSENEIKQLKDKNKKLNNLINQKESLLLDAFTKIKQLSQKADVANKAKSEFLSKMTHEMKTPLNGIIGFAQLLTRKGLSDQETTRYGNRILSSGENLLTMINDILDYSGIVSGQLKIQSELCHLPTFIAEILPALVSFYNGKKIDITIDNAIEQIKVDRQRLAQILHNLLSNAIKYTDGDGNIWIRVKLKDNNQTIRFEIEDQGIGIAEEMYVKVFAMFEQIDGGYSRQHEGTGLGLALTKKIVCMLGGKIWFTSEENKGSHFYFTIPYAV